MRIALAQMRNSGNMRENLKKSIEGKNSINSAIYKKTVNSST